MSFELGGKIEFPVKFGDYELVSKLGQGGMGNVYKARDLSFNREVAIKILSKPGMDEEATTRFEGEANAMKALDHQNIIPVYNYGVIDGKQYIAMKFIEGQTLSDILKEKGKLDFFVAIKYAKQIARGLRYIHKRQIIHRDIKPSNIIITPEDRAYLSDFGISYMKDSERLTTTGMAMGTPEYMSPEQCQGASLNNQSDIYSLGVIIYEMIAGDPPFSGSKALAIAYNHVHKEPEKITHKRRFVPDKLVDIIESCLAKNREKRYSNLSALLNDLDNVDFNLITKATSSFRKKNEQKELDGDLNFSTAPMEKEKPTVSLSYAQLLWILLFLIAVLFSFRLMVQEGNSLKQIANVKVEGKYFSDKKLGNLIPENMMDNKLHTAWAVEESYVNADNQLVFTFPDSNVLFSIGLAVGYQEASTEKWKDKFQLFSKPKEIVVRGDNGQTRRLVINNVRGVQYFSFRPFESKRLIVDIKSIFKTESSSPVAISEFKFYGIPVKY